MGKNKIFIVDCDQNHIDQERKIFEQAGFDYEWKHCQTEQEIIAQCQGAVAVLNQYAPMNAKVFEGISSLKMIVRYGVGVDNIDVEAATRFGIQVCNVPDYGTEEVADHALALMMALSRKLYISAPLVKAGIWDYAKAAPIYRSLNCVVGIIGAGRIGKAFAKRVHSLGCKVIAYDAFVKKESVPDYIALVPSLEDVLKNADIVSLHCFLDEKSQDLINEKTLRLMKSSAFLINVARGGLVNEEDLERAISEKWIAGAGLDVVKKEPMPGEHPLNQHKNVIITPHIAWYSVEAAEDLKTKCAQEAVRFMRAEPVRCPVNKL